MLYTLTISDNAVHLSDPAGSSVLSPSSVFTLLDGNSTTCLTLPRSRLSHGIMGSWYQFYLRIPLNGDTRLIATGKGFSCSMSPASGCEIPASRKMASAKLREDGCPSCGLFQKYELEDETTDGEMTTCKFTTSCGETDCLGVLFTLGYDDFIAEDVQLCDLRLERKT